MNVVIDSWNSLRKHASVFLYQDLGHKLPENILSKNTGSEHSRNPRKMLLNIFFTFFLICLQTAHQTALATTNYVITHYVTKGMLSLDRKTFKQKILLENSRKHASWPKFYPAYNKLFLHLKRALLSHFG